MKDGRPRKKSGKPYRLVGPPHISPRTKGGICGILALALLSVPVGLLGAAGYGLWQVLS